MAKKKKTTKPKKRKKALRKKARARRRRPPRPPLQKRAAPEMSPAFKNFERRLDDVLEDEELDHYELGVLWNELSHEHYAEKELGQTASAWWKAHAGGFCDVRTAKRRGRVARRFKKEVMAAEGDNRLDLLIAYCHAHQARPPANPRPFPIKFKDAAGNQFTKPFSDCSEQEMEWAVRPPRSHPKRKAPPPPPPPRTDPGPLRNAGFWEEGYRLALQVLLAQIGDAERDGRGPAVQWIHDQPFLQLNGIAWTDIQQVAKAMLDARSKCIGDINAIYDDPPPVPDWLKGP
jgi:hypothetical protein